MWRTVASQSLSVVLWISVCLCTSCSIIPPYPDAPATINDEFRDVIEQRRLRYQVKEGDSITLNVYKQDGQLAAQTFLILDDGRSDPFFMTNYKFAGKTLPEIETDVKRLLSAEASDASLSPERVSMTIAPAEDRVYMTGEFVGPETIPLTTTMTLNEAIAEAGGMLVTGDTDYATLYRPYLDPLHPRVYHVDLNYAGETIVLLPGDHVHLGRTFLAAVVVYLREYVFGILPGQLYSAPMAAAF